jgi:hypothetical protein
MEEDWHLDDEYGLLELKLRELFRLSDFYSDTTFTH